MEAFSELACNLTLHSEEQVLLSLPAACLRCGPAGSSALTDPARGKKQLIFESSGQELQGETTTLLHPPGTADLGPCSMVCL